MYLAGSRIGGLVRVAWETSNVAVLYRPSAMPISKHNEQRRTLLNGAQIRLLVVRSNLLNSTRHSRLIDRKSKGTNQDFSG